MMKPPQTLAARIANLRDLQECASELDYSDRVLEIFSEQPLAGSVHIIAVPQPVGES
jgi:hypothetical protein